MTASNGTQSRPQRKQLSDQLDRFDALLDGLSEGLSESIADAVRDGTRLALKDALIEILTDPTLRTKLQQAAAPERPASAAPQALRPGLFAWLKAKASIAFCGVKNAAEDVATAAAGATEALVNAVRQPARLVQLIGSLKQLALCGRGRGLRDRRRQLFRSTRGLGRAFRH